jgi:nucleoside-diphosphate-sugar epimerase
MHGVSERDAPLSEDAPLRPLTPYAESKVSAEETLEELAGDEFAPVSMRNATVYGLSPRLRLDLVLNNLVAWAHTTGAIRLQSDGSSWRLLVHDRLPQCEVTFAEGAVADPRSYRVNFSKFESAFPDCRFEWTAERGADELVRAYEEVGLMFEDFQGHRYIRLGQLKRLLEAQALDAELRWGAEREPPAPRP